MFKISNENRKKIKKPHVLPCKILKELEKEFEKIKKNKFYSCAKIYKNLPKQTLTLLTIQTSVLTKKSLPILFNVNAKKINIVGNRTINAIDLNLFEGFNFGKYLFYLKDIFCIQEKYTLELIKDKFVKTNGETIFEKKYLLNKRNYFKFLVPVVICSGTRYFFRSIKDVRVKNCLIQHKKGTKVFNQDRS